MAEVKITGLHELGESLSRLENEMANKIARSATGAAAQVIKKLEKQKVRVADVAHTIDGTNVPIGTVRDNIITKKVKSPLTSEHIVTVRGKAAHAYASRIGSMLEYGTVKMTPKPFVRPSFDEGKATAVDAMLNKIRAGIEKANR